MMTSLPTALAETGVTSTGEAVFFWVLAPLMVLAALGLLFARRAVYAAMSVVFVMVSLAAMYVALEAPFLGVAQIIVYTGAIMMLFLFVLMLVGVDAADSLVETIRYQRWIAVIAGLGLGVILLAVVLRAAMPAPTGLAVQAGSNPVGVARVLFADHIVTMQVAGIMLVTAALGAVVLTRAERLTPRMTQREMADTRMSSFAAGQGRITALPAPGVYARHNAADVAALGADGRPIDDSVPRVLRIRGQQLAIESISPELARLAAAEHPRAGTRGDMGRRSVLQSGLPGMPGLEQPPGLDETDAGEEVASSSSEDQIDAPTGTPPAPRRSEEEER